MGVEYPETDVIDVTNQPQEKDGELTLNEGLTVNKGIIANPDVGEEAITANGIVSCTTMISGDMAFTDPCCVICEKRFLWTEIIVFIVTRAQVEPKVLTTTVPVHYKCARKRRKVRKWLNKQL